MNVAVEIPEAVSGPLQSKWHDLPGRVLEAVAAEAYRSGVLTTHQVGLMLGHSSRWETEAFLKRVQAYLQYTEADLDRDLNTLRASRGRITMPRVVNRILSAAPRYGIRWTR
jgi:hypothetical protein